MPASNSTSCYRPPQRRRPPPHPQTKTRTTTHTTLPQVKYVVELAKALARHPAVHRVDLLTRLIRDPSVDAGYGAEEELLVERGAGGAAGGGSLGGAYIVRLPCGPVEKYLR